MLLKTYVKLALWTYKTLFTPKIEGTHTTIIEEESGLIQDTKTLGQTEIVEITPLGAEEVIPSEGMEEYQPAQFAEVVTIGQIVVQTKTK